MKINTEDIMSLRAIDAFILWVIAHFFANLLRFFYQRFKWQANEF